MPNIRVRVISEDAHLILPVEIYTPSGSLVGSGVVSSWNETTFGVSSREKSQADKPLERVYVFAKLPGGGTIQEHVELGPTGWGKAILNTAKHSPYKWLEWVTPFRSLQHLSDNQAHALMERSAEAGSVRRIGKVWATLWEFQEQRWEARNVKFESLRGNRGIRQLTIEVPRHPHLLQLGGEELAWRLVSLPPGEKVNIALTPSPKEVGGDALEITVGRQYPVNELVMSYLSRGDLPEVSQLADFMSIADRMLYGKYDDPISAVAGGYILLRTGQLDRRAQWLNNLERYVPYIADVKIIKAALAREQEGVAENDIRQMLLDSLEIGLPVFSLGMTLLVDSMAAMHRGEHENRQFHRAYLAVQAYVRAKCSKGAYLAFYGKSPAEPLWSPIYGTEQKGAATPVSQGSSPAVFMRRPKGSPRSVRYGATSVTLPLAPVSGKMLEVSPESLDTPQRVAEPDHWLSVSDLPITVRGQARPLRDPVLLSVEMQEIPEYLAAMEIEPEKLTIKEASIRQTPSPLEKRESVAEQKPRQNAQYWKEARIYHSVSVMDEDE